jgi:hypothetical protein
MKLNLRVIIAAVVIVGVIVSAVDSVRARSYSGNDLNFVVGRGPVTVTNSSDQPVPAQLLSKGSRSFSVSSTFENVSDTSTMEGTGSNRSQLFAFELPPGDSEFTVVRATNATTDVNFVANTDTRLGVSALPLNGNDTRNTIIVAVVVVLGALFYMSHTTGHLWISASRRKAASDLAAKQLAENAAFKSRFGRTNPEKS